MNTTLLVEDKYSDLTIFSQHQLWNMIAVETRTWKNKELIHELTKQFNKNNGLGGREK